MRLPFLVVPRNVFSKYKKGRCTGRARGRGEGASGAQAFTRRFAGRGVRGPLPRLISNSCYGACALTASSTCAVTSPLPSHLASSREHPSCDRRITRVPQTVNIVVINK
ncbi:hypothetical protein EVAR_92131_1 [Eumeta japonica]|uniref:Uncharacterized protein n=1 Tax=Eumeta variegata TaxID=151549 RepID=A0A4C1SYH9_EUMVA|nr:hypothetical protein EVAR_92131_1 [Eumeta japonica]